MLHDEDGNGVQRTLGKHDATLEGLDNRLGRVENNQLRTEEKLDKVLSHIYWHKGMMYTVAAALSASVSAAIAWFTRN